MKRLEEHHLPYEYAHLSYPHAGHVIRFPYLPTTQLRLNGGSPAANHGDSQALWQFVQRNFPVQSP